MTETLDSLRVALEERLRFETVVADLSAQFVNVDSDLIDGAIQDAQRRIVEVLDLDRSSLFQFSREEQLWKARNMESMRSVAAAGSGTILFVEDDECIRTLGTRMLRLHGFTVLPAQHSAEALQLAADRDRRIDLLFTDIVMPGLSGRELAARMLQARPWLKVLYTSGYSDEVVARCDIAVNAPGFVRKPYSPDALVRQIRTLLASE